MSTIPKKRNRAINIKGGRGAVAVLPCCRPVPLAPATVKAIASRVLKEEGVRPGTLCVVLASDAMIREANSKFTGRRGATDVLAFDMRRTHDGGVFWDVMVSVDTARRQARRLGIAAGEEMARYIIHGILHLAGYDDTTPEKKKRMWKRQEELVKAIKNKI